MRRYQIFLPDGMTRKVSPLPSATENLFSRGSNAAIFLGVSMTTSFKKAYKFDASGFFEHELTVQVMDGQLVPPSCTLIAPFGDEGEDGSKFYRFTGDAWAAELKPTCAADLVGVVVSHHSQTPHDIEMRSLIQKFAQEEGYREKRGEDLSWSVEKIPEKTPEEKLAETEEEVRSKRDRLIADTDYLLMNDYPSEDLESVKAYRQALRDVPQQDGFPYELVWPKAPDVFKATNE